MWPGWVPTFGNWKPKSPRDIKREVHASLKVRLNRLPRIDPDPNGKLRSIIRAWEVT